MQLIPSITRFYISSNVTTLITHLICCNSRTTEHKMIESSHRRSSRGRADEQRAGLLEVAVALVEDFHQDLFADVWKDALQLHQGPVVLWILVWKANRKQSP